ARRDEEDGGDIQCNETGKKNGIIGKNRNEKKKEKRSEKEEKRREKKKGITGDIKSSNQAQSIPFLLLITTANHTNRRIARLIMRIAKSQRRQRSIQSVIGELQFPAQNRLFQIPS